jgi:hypothetical protein
MVLNVVFIQLASGISCCHSKLTHPPPPLLPPFHQSLSHLAGLRYCEHHTMKCPKAFVLSSYFVLCVIYDIYVITIAGQWEKRTNLRLTFSGQSYTDSGKNNGLK